MTMYIPGRIAVTFRCIMSPLHTVPSQMPDNNVRPLCIMD